MKRFSTVLSLVLAAALLFAIAGCTKAPVDTTPTTTTPPTTTAPATTNAPETTAPELSPVTYFTLSYGTTLENTEFINAYPNEDGSAHVDYSSDIRKAADLDAEVFTQIADALANSGLMELNEEAVYEEGEASASAYVEFSDGTFLTINYTGEIPEKFIEGYEAVDTFFLDLLKDVAEYVPTPSVEGEVDQALLDSTMEIMNGSGIQELDGFYITQVAKDEYFAYTVGLTSEEGIANAVSCAPMMMTTAYSLVIVTLEEGADPAAVAKDFEESIDWRKWVCVNPSDALIAQKDQQVLCLIGGDSLYSGTATGIEAAGWTVLNTLKNPDM